MRRGDFLEPQRRGRAVAALTASVTVVAAVIALNAGSAAGETPAERCARETAAYNAAWESSWWASNPGNPGPPPPPPVPYVCHDPGEPTTTTPTTPPTAPGLQPTQTPGDGVQGQAGNAPGQLPQGNGTDIVAGPTASPAMPPADRAVPTDNPPAKPEPDRTSQEASPIPVRPSSAPSSISGTQSLQTVADREGPPSIDEGPNANGCAHCKKDENGALLTGDVGGMPGLMSGYAYHWVIDEVTWDGVVASPSQVGPPASCSSPAEKPTLEFSSTAFAGTESSQNASLAGTLGPLEGGGDLSNSKSESKEIQSTRSVEIDCKESIEANALEPGKIRVFYQNYNKYSWKGHWTLYYCAFGICKKKDSGPASGVYYAPMAGFQSVDVDAPALPTQKGGN